MSKAEEREYLVKAKKYESLEEDLKVAKLNQNKEQINKIQKELDESLECRNKILSANLRFVFDVAKKYRGQGIPISDLISEGNLGMIRAMEKFDLSKDVKFYTYASWWIKQRMKRAIENYHDKHDKEDSFDVTFQNVIINKEDILCVEDDNESCDNDIKDKFSDSYESREIEEKRKETVNKLLSNLDDRERIIIEKYFGIEKGDKGCSLTEIGKNLNLCTERIRQLKVKALNTMRKEIFNIEEVEILLR